MIKDQKGFSAVEAILIALVILTIGGAGYYVYQRNRNDTKRNSAADSQDKQTPNSGTADTPTSEANDLQLDGGKVSFTLPEHWTYKQGKDKCVGNATADVTCVEGAVITPGENLPTRYGDGTEYFSISASVFDNPDGSSAQTWLEEDFQSGIGNGDVQKSTAKINGYNAFSRTQQYDGDGTTIREMEYVFSVKDKVVYIHARTYEPGTRNGQAVGDFRKFEPAISAMAQSVKVDY